MEFIVILGSKNKKHISDNLNILDFEHGDMEKIAILNKSDRYYNA